MNIVGVTDLWLKNSDTESCAKMLFNNPAVGAAPLYQGVGRGAFQVVQWMQRKEKDLSPGYRPAGDNRAMGLSPPGQLDLPGWASPSSRVSLADEEERKGHVCVMKITVSPRKK